MESLIIRTGFFVQDAVRVSEALLYRRVEECNIGALIIRARL